MREREVKPLAPRRKELPCDFAVAKGTRNSTLARAACVVLLGGLAAFCGGANVFDEGPAAGDVTTWVFLVGGFLFVAGGVYLATTAFVGVRIDDEGLLVRRPGRTRRVPWTDVRRLTFGARRVGTRRPRGLPGVVVQAALGDANAMHDEDPYYFGRVRPQFEPYADLSTSGKGEAFTETLGWGSFLALYAEAEARGIAIVRIPTLSVQAILH